MKSGAGDDPFAEEGEAETESEASGSENAVGETGREDETTEGEKAMPENGTTMDERTVPKNASRADGEEVDGDADGRRVRGGGTVARGDTAAAGEATNEDETVGTADVGADTGSDDSGGPADGAGTVADGEATQRPAGGSSADEDESTSGGSRKTSAGSSGNGNEAGDGGPRDIEIPWVLRRGSVKDDRPNVTQFFLRDETDAAERRFKNEVEEIIDADVYTLDLREAAYLVAMRHPEEVAEELRAWGYDYLD